MGLRILHAPDAGSNSLLGLSFRIYRFSGVGLGSCGVGGGGV